MSKKVAASIKRGLTQASQISRRSWRGASILVDPGATVFRGWALKERGRDLPVVFERREDAEAERCPDEQLHPCTIILGVAEKPASRRRRRR